jgi:hypothetical protein
MSIKKNIEQMWCGACGGKDYLVFRDIDSGEIMTKCKHCKSVSIIQFRIKTVLEWGDEDQPGCMTSDHFHK